MTSRGISLVAVAVAVAVVVVASGGGGVIAAGVVDCCY